MGRYEPLTPSERAVLDACLAGEGPELEMLRAQLEVAVWAARLSDAPFLGFIPRRKEIIVRDPFAIRFKSRHDSH